MPASSGSGLLPAAVRATLLERLTPVVAPHGVDLEDVVVTPAGRRRSVQVVVDADGGVSSDALTEVSRAVSAALDEVGELGDTPYVLEVSTPGVDRPLLERRHWRRARGRLVTITVTEGAPVQGRLTHDTDEGLTVLVDDVARQVPWESVARGRVEIEFSGPSTKET